MSAKKTAKTAQVNTQDDVEVLPLSTYETEVPVDAVHEIEKPAKVIVEKTPLVVQVRDALKGIPDAWAQKALELDDEALNALMQPAFTLKTALKHVKRGPRKARVVKDELVAA